VRLAAHLAEVLAREQIEADPEALALLAREAAGSVRDALSLCDQVVAFVGPRVKIERTHVIDALGVTDRRALFELADAVLARDAEAALRVLDAAHAGGGDLGQLARAFLGHLRDLAVCATVQDVSGLVDAPATELEALRAQAGAVEPALAGALFERFALAADEIARSTFPKMLIELALLDLVRAEPLYPLGDLLERLEDLEKRTAGGGGGESGGVKTRPAAGTRTGTGTSTGRGTRTETSTKTSPSTGAEPASPLSWEQFLADLAERAPATYGTLALAKPVAFGADGVALAFEPGDFGVAEMRKPEIEKLVAAAFGGQRVAVTLQALEPQGTAAAAPSLDETNQRRAEEERERRRTEARTHPAVTAAREIFGADIKDIKVE